MSIRGYDYIQTLLAPQPYDILLLKERVSLIKDVLRLVNGMSHCFVQR